MKPDFRKPADGRRRIAEDQARLTFGRQTGFEVEGDRQNAFLAMTEEFAEQYHAGVLQDEDCATLRDVAKHLPHSWFRGRLQALLDVKDHPRNSLQAIVGKVYDAWDWIRSHLRGQAVVHWDGAVAKFDPVPPEEIKERRKQREREKRKNHALAAQAQALDETTQVDLQVVHAPKLPTQRINLPTKPPSRAS